MNFCGPHCFWPDTHLFTSFLAFFFSSHFSPVTISLPYCYTIQCRVVAMSTMIFFVHVKGHFWGQFPRGNALWVLSSAKVKLEPHRGISVWDGNADFAMPQDHCLICSQNKNATKIAAVVLNHCENNVIKFGHGFLIQSIQSDAFVSFSFHNEAPLRNKTGCVALFCGALLLTTLIVCMQAMMVSNCCSIINIAG